MGTLVWRRRLRGGWSACEGGGLVVSLMACLVDVRGGLRVAHGPRICERRYAGKANTRFHEVQDMVRLGVGER